MIRDSDFYNILANIANSLKGINESLSQLKMMRKTETEQILRESRKRMRGERTLLKESKEKSNSYIREDRNSFIREYKNGHNNSVNTQNSKSNK